MNAIALTISDIPVRQDSFGRFCLNDLHKASGDNPSQRPSNWLRNQQAKDLIQELSSNLSLAPVETVKGGKSPGIFVVKELVYAYAMWISAKFHIAVIRAYDAMVTGQLPPASAPERKTKKALPGCLTPEQQDHIKALVKSRGERVLPEKAAGTIIKTWSSIKSKFGCSYKEIPQEEYLNVISLIERLPIEGELIEKSEILPNMTTSTEFDYKAAKEHIQHLREIARVGVDDVLLNEFDEELCKLDRCIVRAWTEMDEAISRIQTSLFMLRRWRNK